MIGAGFGKRKPTPLFSTNAPRRRNIANCLVDRMIEDCVIGRLAPDEAVDAPLIEQSADESDIEAPVRDRLWKSSTA